MLHILLMILKIIGILIAVILGLLLFSLLVIVFAPLHYEIDAMRGESSDSFKVEVRGRWLYRLIAGFVCYEPESMRWQLRIAWKKMNPGSQTQQEDSPKETEESVEKSPDTSKPVVQEQKPKRVQEEPDLQKNMQREKPVHEEPKRIESHPKLKKKRKRFSRMEKWRALLRKIKFTIAKICDTIKGIGEKKEKILEFIGDETHRTAFVTLKKEALRFLRFLKPKDIRGRIHYGFEEPYDTGRALAGLSILYPFYGDNLKIQPDFEKKILEGELHIRGKLRGIYVGIVLFHLFRSKEIRTTYQHIRQFQL